MSDRDSGLDSGEESNDTMFMNDENNDNSSLENVGDAIGDEVDDVDDDDDDDEDLNNYIVYNVNGDRGNGGAMMDNRAIISGNRLLNSSANHQMINNHYNDIIEIDPSPSPALSQISQSSMNHNLAQASTSFDNINFASSSSSGLMRASSSSLFPNNSSSSNSGTGSNQMFDQWSSSLVSSSFPALSSSSSLSSSGPNNSQSKMCLSTSIQEHQNNPSQHQHNQFDSNLASTSSSCSSSNSSILPPAPSSSPVVGVSSSFSSSSTLVVPSSSASSSSSSSALSISMSQNVNVFGVDFCINPADLSNLWNFYIDNSDMEQQQHEFCPKMSSKKGHRRKFVQIQFSQNLIAEKKLRMASNANDFESVCRLLKAGVDTKACDERKRTALHFAACHGFIDIACALLDNGADPNQQDIVGNTPLHLAVCASKLDIVILLLKNGANCTASDNSGRTPLQLAKAKLTILSKSLEKSKSLLPELKLETLKISMMLGIYFEKSVITNNDDHSRQMKNQQQKEEIERFQNRINTGETAEELENDVNDLLRCIDKWTLT